MADYRLPVRQALRSLLIGDFSRLYLYPEEHSQMPKLPEVPFGIIAEVAGTREATLMDASNEFVDFWRVALYIYTAYGELVVPSTEDAAAKASAMEARDIVRDLLISDYTIGGTTLDMGTDESVFELLVTPFQWRGSEPAYGAYFEIPVLTRL